MNIAASTGLHRCKMGGLPSLLQGWPQPSFPGPEAKDCLRRAEKFAPGGWRLGCPGQEHLTAWVFAKGITLQMVRTPPFILPLFMEWEQRFVLLMNNIF